MLVWQLVVVGVCSGAAYALVAVGFCISVRVGRYYNICHGVLYTTGAYLSYSLVAKAGVPFVPGLIAACLVCGVLGAGLHAAVSRPLKDRGATPAALMIASLGMYYVLESIVAMVWGEETRSLRLGEVTIGMNVFGARVSRVELGTVVAGIVTLAGLVAGVKHTRWGAVYRAVAGDRELSRLSGIRASLHEAVGMGLAGSLAGAAGTIVGLEQDLAPHMGFRILLKAMVAVLVAGSGRLESVAAVAMLIGMCEAVSLLWFSAVWVDSITYVTLLLALTVHAWRGRTDRDIRWGCA